MKVLHFSSALFTLLLFNAVSIAETTNINTSSIIRSAASASCINYQVVGVCFWLQCGHKCKVKVSPKVGHFNPDLVVSAHNGVGNNPWSEANAVVGTASQTALNTILATVGGTGSNVEAGSNRSGTDLNHQAMKFKSSDVIGHPLATIPIGYRCPSQATSMMPYFISGTDALAWRFGLPEMVYPEALIPGKREIGHFPANTWGSVYPRSGFINQTSDAKAAAVIAQRAGDIVTRQGQSHVYQSVQRSVGGNMKTWPPGGLLENTDKTGKWQMLTPNESKTCNVFGENDITTLTGWDGGKQATTGNYAWTLWRPYKCCQKKGQFFLYSIDFISYP